jgi:hypothetical protein
MGSSSVDSALPAHVAGLVPRVRKMAQRQAERFEWLPEGRRKAFSAKEAEPSLQGPNRPLRILLCDHERTLFNYVADDRVTVMRPGDAGAEDADLLVITRADRGPFENRVGMAPAALWVRVARGEAKLVLDSSGEGHEHKSWGRTKLHGFLQSRSIRPSDAAYITQDRRFAAHYARACREAGMDGPGMTILVHDLYIRRLFASVEKKGEHLFQQRLAAYASRRPRRERRFVCLNNTVRPIKALFLLRLLKEGLWDNGHISVGRLGEMNSGTMLSRAELVAELKSQSGFADLAPELEPWLDRLEALGPVSLGFPAGDASMAAKRALLGAAALEEYDASWFTVVTESEANHRLHRITEKPFKPLLNFHPMMILGSHRSLRLVRAYGFRTFPELFDEDLDEEADPRKRFERVFAETARLCALDEAELQRLEDALSERVIFNACWGLTVLPKLMRTHIDSALVDRLLSFAAPVHA